jgi:hypothetical protein
MYIQYAIQRVCQHLPFVGQAVTKKYTNELGMLRRLHRYTDIHIFPRKSVQIWLLKSTNVHGLYSELIALSTAKMAPETCKLVAK